MKFWFEKAFHLNQVRESRGWRLRGNVQFVVTTSVVMIFLYWNSSVMITVVMNDRGSGFRRDINAHGSSWQAGLIILVPFQSEIKILLVNTIYQFGEKGKAIPSPGAALNLKGSPRLFGQPLRLKARRARARGSRIPSQYSKHYWFCDKLAFVIPCPYWRAHSAWSPDGCTSGPWFPLLLCVLPPRLADASNDGEVESSSSVSTTGLSR